MDNKTITQLFEASRKLQAAKEAEIEEKSADHFYDMALISWKMKRHDQALTHVEQAIKLNTEFSRARLLKLEILLTSDRKTEALNHLKGWIVKNKDAKTFSILSMLTGSSTVSPQEAIALLESITNQPSIQKEIHSFLGDLHALTGNYKAAEKSYRYFLRALGKSDRPMGLKAMYNLGFVQWKQGNVKEALTEIGRAHSLDQKHPLITSFLAFLYTQQEDKHKVRKAKELLELARNIEQNPDQTPSELCMAGKTSNLSSILAAQADAYKLSPFWLNLETSGIQPEVPKLDSHVTMTAQNTGLCI